MRSLLARIGHFRELVRGHPWGSVVGVALLAYTAFGAWRDDFATPQQQEALRAVNFLPHLSLAWWIVIALVVALIWMFEASFYRQRSGLEIIMNKNEVWGAMFGSQTKTLRLGAFVQIKNKTDKRLEYCRVQLRFLKGPKAHLPSFAVFPVNDPFPLLPDEGSEVAVLKYEFTGDGSKMFVPAHQARSGTAIYFPHEQTLEPGNYRIRIEALCGSTRMATEDISLTHDGKRWFFQGVPALREDGKVNNDGIKKAP